MKKTEPEQFGAHSRRTFLKSLGTVAATAATVQVQSVAAELEKANAEKTVGPGPVPVTLKVNGVSDSHRNTKPTALPVKV